MFIIYSPVLLVIIICVQLGYRKPENLRKKNVKAGTGRGRFEILRLQVSRTRPEEVQKDMVFLRSRFGLVFGNFRVFAHSTIYTSSQGSRPVKCDVIGLRKCRWSKFVVLVYIHKSVQLIRFWLNPSHFLTLIFWPIAVVRNDSLGP